jgi:hypothetical protein
METLHRELGPEGLTVLLVNLFETRAVAERAVAGRRYTAPVLLDPDGRAAQAYGVRGPPSVFVIGRDGTLLGGAVGPRPWAEQPGRALLQALLRTGARRDGAR